MDYIEEAHVTASGKYYGERVALFHFCDVLKEVIEALEKLDAIKKALFYGRDTGVPAPEANASTLATLPFWISNHPDNDRAALNIIHGVIGKATEAGELLEALFKVCAEGQTFNKINALEEIGDGLWYDALLLRALDCNFDDAMALNIAKLRSRFPNAFTEHNANNRDLCKERKILEQKA